MRQKNQLCLFLTYTTYNKIKINNVSVKNDLKYIFNLRLFYTEPRVTLQHQNHLPLFRKLKYKNISTINFLFS